MLEKTEKISTGSYDLNKWLYGGYEKGVITMIVGPPGSGKTNFVILAACSQAKKGNKVLFIDTEGGFSPERVKQIVSDNFEETLKNIVLLEPKDFEEQKRILSTINSQIKKERFSLIILDSIAMLYRLGLGDAKEKGEEDIKRINREAASQMKLFAELCKNQNLPILITNQVYQGFLPQEKLEQGVEKETNIVGGDLFQYWSKCIIELKNDRGKRKAKLLKHRSLPQKEITFEIKDQGITKKGWI